jgi:type I restriction enzyme M protein
VVNGDIEKRLWAVADQLWANTGLKPAQFSTPVLGLIFLRYAETKFADAEKKIGPVGSGTRRKISKADYQAEGVIFLRPEARFSCLQKLTEGDDIGKAINDAMKAIEEENDDPQHGQADRSDATEGTAQPHPCRPARVLRERYRHAAPWYGVWWLSG